MIGHSRSPALGPMSSETDRSEDSPPPAPDVTADPRAPKSQSAPSSTSSDRNILYNGPPLVGLRNNEVRSVMLYGIPIVALVIDGYERLCLAQISNTLLKTFSYNEIHNRRVALGITCVQCTPVQLELLRRAGAMPVSSRRCGLITKREAERLCKSFLADTKPPKLPDNFAFDVVHHCAWGCRGSFVPSRYNSSRAKCIKCTYCGLFFSPNKFIFHSHRLPESKYVQPDAANFNSWRRHIRLGGTPPDEVVYAWEDVKAMFNGGSRKRITHCASVSRSHDHKRPRLPSRSDAAPTSSEPSQPPKPPYFPVVPLPNKGFSLQTAPPFVAPTAPPFGLAGKPLSPADIRQTFAEYMWAGKQPFPLPYGGVLWPRPAGMVPPAVEMRDTRPSETCPTSSIPYSLADTTTIADSGQSRPLSSASDGTSRSFPDHPEDSPGSPLRGSNSQPSPPHTSAFRPVGRARTLHVEAAQADTAVDTTTSGRFDLRPDSRCCDESSEHDEVDVTDISNDGEDITCHTASADDLSGTPPALIAVTDLTSAVPDTSAQYTEKLCRKEEKRDATDSPGSQDADSASANRLLFRPVSDKSDPVQLSAGPTSLQDGRPVDNLLLDPQRLSSLSKEELKEVLLQEAEARRRAEREYQMIRDTFEEQVRKEIAYREEVAKQLQIVREAHDALHHFSCKMLASRHCTECGYKPSMPE